MASIPASRLSAPPYFHRDPKKTLAQPLLAASLRRAASRSSALCRCSRGDDAGSRGWDSMIHGVIRSALKKWGDYVNSLRSGAPKEEGDLDSVKGEDKGDELEEEEEEVEEQLVWDWERWKRHFAEVEEQERLVSSLKSRLHLAVLREDYQEAAKLNVSLNAARKVDTVGAAICDLNQAIAEERYDDAAFFRDHAGVGLIGWWYGISTNAAESYGQIIQINAEHGRYVARSYSSRQLSMARPGSPLFEIFFTFSGGEYKQQAVYLKHKNGPSGGLPLKIPPKLDVSSSNPSDADGQGDMCVEDITAVEEKNDDSDMVDGVVGIQNVLQDIIPGVKVKVLNVVSPGKVDRDLIAKVIEEIIEEDDEDNDEEMDSVEADDSTSESDDEEVIDYGEASSNIFEQTFGMTSIIIGGEMQKLATDLEPKNLVRVPAVVERKDHRSFLFTLQQNDAPPETDREEQSLDGKVAEKSNQRSADLVMSDLAKVFLTKEKIPMKVLKDVGELISSTIKQEQDRPFSGSMLFNRIDIPLYADPLSGLYIGANGMYASEVLHLKRKFGQWQDSNGPQKHADLEFYEYVEALKLTGGLSVPAGQVVFRAKVGKRNQLPHKGIIPEEFGVVARYKGQGRLADPGFQNSRWVDGELVILDGKFIRGGPVIGFVYWAPEYHFLVFFNQLKLPET